MATSVCRQRPRNLAAHRSEQVIAALHEGQVACAVAHADAENGAVAAAVLLLQAAHGVGFVEPGRQQGKVVAVPMQLFAVAQLSAQNISGGFQAALPLHVLAQSLQLLTILNRIGNAAFRLPARIRSFRWMPYKDAIS